MAPTEREVGDPEGLKQAEQSAQSQRSNAWNLRGRRIRRAVGMGTAVDFCEIGEPIPSEPGSRGFVPATASSG